jgi:hypothetical protein
VEVVTCATVVPETFIFGPVRRVDASRSIGKANGILIVDEYKYGALALK